VSRERPGAVGFTDIAGFTAFTAACGDDAALELLDLQDRITRDSLPPGARIVKSLGDGLMLWMPEAAPALAACLDLRDTFEKGASEGEALWVRIGMHWGCPTARGDDLVGHDVNIAARIVELASPGELLVSGPACDAAGDAVRGLRLEELGPVVMRGIPRPVPLFRASRD
jgi:adenylate cyclase